MESAKPVLNVDKILSDIQTEIEKHVGCDVRYEQLPETLVKILKREEINEVFFAAALLRNEITYELQVAVWPFRRLETPMEAWLNLGGGRMNEILPIIRAKERKEALRILLLECFEKLEPRVMRQVINALAEHLR